MIHDLRPREEKIDRKDLNLMPKFKKGATK